jgi:hypothetical protein
VRAGDAIWSTVAASSTTSVRQQRLEGTSTSTGPRRGQTIAGTGVVEGVVRYGSGVLQYPRIHTAPPTHSCSATGKTAQGPRMIQDMVVLDAALHLSRTGTRTEASQFDSRRKLAGVSEALLCCGVSARATPERRASTGLAVHRRRRSLMEGIRCALADERLPSGHIRSHPRARCQRSGQGRGHEVTMPRCQLRTPRL